MTNTKICRECGIEKVTTAFKKRGTSIGNICRNCTYAKSSIIEHDYSKEEWRSVKGYEGLYEVSNFSRVRSLSRNIPFRKASRFIQGQFITPQYAEYIRVTLCRDRNERKYFTHVLSAIVFVPNPENKPKVNHKDHNKYNCDVTNLEWVTHLENMNDADEYGLLLYGSKSPKAKLDESKVIQIKNILKNKDKTHKEIGEMFNISKQTIDSINTNRNWKRVII